MSEGVKRGLLATLLLATLLLASISGCHLLYPFDTEGTDDPGPSDSDADLGVVHDLGDGPPQQPLLTLAFKDPASIPAGQYARIEIKAQGGMANYKATASADTCLLSLPGSQRASASLAFDLTVPGAKLLGLFAPLDAKPGTVCNLTVKVGAASIGTKATLTAPEHELINLGDYKVNAVKGLTVTHLGKLTGAGQVQGATFARGSFGGELVVGTGERSNSGSGISPSTVKIFRVAPATSGTLAIAPALNLTNKYKNPTVLDELFWSDAGPCSPDAVYLVAHYDDVAYSSDPQKGTITCLDAMGQLSEAFNVSARAAAFLPSDDFIKDAKRGDLIYAHDTKTYHYEDKSSVVSGAVGGGHHLLRVGRAGIFAGQLFSISASKPETLRQIPAPPNQTAINLLTVGQPEIGLAVSPGGTFRSVVVSATRPKYGVYDLQALVLRTGVLRQVPLLTAVTCGYAFDFDGSGHNLLLLAADQNATSCKSTWSAYRVEFKLP